MGQIVVVAEKPSVGRDIARVLGCNVRGEGCLKGEGYTVTWAVGHLVTLMEPDELDERYKRWSNDTLPILPADIPLKVIQQTKDQFQVVKRIMNAADTDKVICATDAGREGELIFRYIYEMADCRKPIFRLWINSMTDEAIAEGFRKIKPGDEYLGLYRSAQCRSQADWLVGMNATRAFTLRYDALLSVGRVQTPTLAILVKRRKEIEAFKPEGFATLTADFGDYKGIWFSPDREPDTHLKDKAEAQSIADQIKKKHATVISAETTRGRDMPPQLYDLTSLQRDANKLLGFTADKTLQLAQSLYEKHKALTYPRTDSRYLPPDMIPRVVQTMHLLPQSYQAFVPGALPDGKLPVSKRTIDETKVTDHHALIPTAKSVRPETFSEDERQLYDLVTRRLLQAFYPPCEYDATKVITQSEGHQFRTNGRVILKNGWKDVPALAVQPKTRKKKKEEEEEAPLPPLKAGDQRTVTGTSIKEDMTKPPLQHNDASLLNAMENAGKELDDEEIARQMKGSGIGTPATRAAIIERLIQVGYAERKGKNLQATDKGVQLISIMPQEIASPELTGRWELALDKIAHGNQDPDQFMDSIRRFSSFLVTYAQTKSPRVTIADKQRQQKRAENRKKWADNMQNFGKELPNCTCPLCSKGIIKETERSFFCSDNGKGCNMTLWKDTLTRGGGPLLNEKLLRLLLKEHQVRGSTGVIILRDNSIFFYPNGSDEPSVVRKLAYTR